MADRLKELTPVNVTFSTGESPTPNKLESSFAQLSNAMDILERAIGDTWNQSSETSGPLYADPNYITNLSRAVGNMSYLNPSSLGENELSATAEAVPEGRNVFVLNNAPDNPTVEEEVVFSNPGTVFQTLVATKELVDGSGDYFIKPNGMVYTFNPTGPSHTVDYTYTTVADSYSGASYNVIPDPSQTDSRCTVIVSGSGRQITLPTVTDSGSLNYTQQLSLPGELDSLADDEEIPSGYIYVWDNIGDGASQRPNSIVEGLTFRKIGAPGSSLATFYAEGVDLAISATQPNRYSVICTGAKTTRVMAFLRDYLISHTHNDNISQFLTHSDLLGSDDTITHGTSSDIVGVDDIQTLTNKVMVDPVLYDSGGAPNVMIRALDDGIRFLKATDTGVYRELHLNSIPEYLTGKAAQYVIDAVDGVAEIPANSTATAGNLLPLNGSGEFPASVIAYAGLNADTVDGKHVAGTDGAGEITTNDGSQTLTNKTLTSPDINGGTMDLIISLTAANNLDIGNYDFRAKTITADVTTGTAPLVVNSTTKVSNLNVDLLDGLTTGNSSGQIPISNGTRCVDLNADKLDSQTATYYTDASNLDSGTLSTDRFNDSSHGNRSGGGLHADATPSVSGFLSAADKTDINTLTGGGTADTLHSHSAGSSGTTYRTASGSYTVPAGVTSIRVSIWGGGGGAQTSHPINAMGEAGGGGGFSMKTIAVSPAQVISLTIGSGGAMDSAGGTTSFGAGFTASGGGAGGVTNTGGTGSGGAMNLTGQTGTKYNGASSGATGIGGAAPRGGLGGINSGGGGDDGLAPGGGGASGYNTSTPGAGADGAVLIEY